MVLLLLAAAQLASGHASPPNFFVTTAISTSPAVNVMLLVTNGPFGYVQISTNDPGGSVLDYSPDGTLFGVAGDALAIIDPATANASNAATLASSVSGAPIAAAAMAFDSRGTMYVSDGYIFYTVDPGSGACTPVNSFHTNSPAAKLTTPIYGLAAANGTLFGGDLNLYTIDPATATATSIGAICAFPYYAQARDMAVGSDGNLYMIGQDVFGRSALYAVDTNTAQLALVGPLPGQAMGLASSISPAFPAIDTQPASLTVMPGDDATFSVNATGIPEPAPQWYFNNAPLPSAAAFSLAISNVSAANAGSYFVVLANSSGAVTSSVVTLTVTTNIVATNFTFLATTPYNGGSSEILSLSTNPVSQTTLAYTGALLNCLAFGTNNVLYGAGDFLYTIDTNTWGVTAIGPIQTAQGGPLLTLSSMAFSRNGSLYGVSGNEFYVIGPTNGAAVLVNAYPQNMAVSAIAFGPTGILYGGQEQLFTLGSTNGGLTSRIGAIIGASFGIGSDMKAGADGYLYFGNGQDLNLFRLNPRTGFATAVASFNSVLAGLAFYPAPFDTTPPAITSLPTNPVATLGGTVTFAATAIGAGPRSYQWSLAGARLQDGSRITGSATSTLTIGNLMASDAGIYTLQVSNLFGVTSKPAANLTLGAGPVITVQPAAATRVIEDNNLALSVTAKGGTAVSPLLYQWMEGGAIIPGATIPKLTLTASPIDGASNLFYTVLIRNSFGVTLSAPAQVTVLRNPARPAVAITVPAPNARTTNNLISGTASGDATTVVYWSTNINNGATNNLGPFELAPVNGKWSASPALLPGTNILFAISSNQDGNVSILESRPFFYEVKAALTLNSAGGSGTFTGKAAAPGDALPADGAMLNIGEGYAVTTKPAADSLFASWTGPANAATTPTIHFVMENGLRLTADFTTNEFFGMAGVYNGLFPNANAVTEASAGMISGLTLQDNGAYSGVLTLKGVNHSLAGRFNAACQSSNYIRLSVGALAVTMNLQTNTYPNQIFGLVSGPGWQSDIHLNAKAANVPSAAETMVLPPPLNVKPGPQQPSFGGYGYAVITNHAGLVSFSGKLADGAVFIPSTPIGQDASVPLYASLYSNTGLLTGWLNFGSGAPQGQLTWIRPSGRPGSLYAGGFTNVITVEGSPWVARSPGVPALPPVTQNGYSLQISGGSLPDTLEFLVTVGANNVLGKSPASLSTNSLTGSINPKTGLLTVTFGNGKGKATATGTGVVLQNANAADGSFLGTTNSGLIQIGTVYP
ncbi:MAG TPA: immunoglobulin domain-containing protein [Verrucomicrobiae bacterium]